MKIAEMISRRRSVRAYRTESISPERLEKLQAYMEGLAPLLPGARVSARLIPTAHGSFLQKWKTPHFIAIFSDGSDDALLNAGFMYQQLDLYAQSIGLGTCWVGLGSLTEEESVPDGMKLAVMMAVGLPDNVPERTPADFKRKPMAELTDRPDERLEALRLALIIYLCLMIRRDKCIKSCMDMRNNSKKICSLFSHSVHLSSITNL